MKYITLHCEVAGIALLVFSGNLSHADVARKHGVKKVLSAGFIRLKGGALHCEGRSESLDVPSRPSDSQLANAYFQ